MYGVHNPSGIYSYIIIKLFPTETDSECLLFMMKIGVSCATRTLYSWSHNDRNGYSQYRKRIVINLYLVALQPPMG